MSNPIQPPNRRRISVAEILLSVSAIVVIILAAYAVLTSGRQSMHLRACRDNLQRIGHALQQYHERYQSFPPAYVADSNGRPMHSWRALLLPFLDEPELAQSYRWDEAWDGPNNRKLWDQIPSVYRCPAASSKQPRRATNYLACVGPTTIWPEAFAVPSKKVADGLSNTIQLLEHDMSGICWLEPRDIPVSILDKEKLIRVSDFLSSQHHDGAHILLADDSVRFLSTSVSSHVFAYLLTIRAGLPWLGTRIELETTPMREFPPVIDASVLERTDVWPHTHRHLESGRNYVYCATMQLAWQKLAESLGPESLELTSKPALAAELNQHRFDPQWLAAESYSANVGRAADVLELVRQQRLPSKLLEESVASDPAVWVVHCTLQKALPFEIAFDRLGVMPFHDNGNEKPVTCFGLDAYSEHDGTANVKGSQIRLIDIVSDNDFIIELVSKQPNDRLILALIQPSETLAATIETVEQRLVIPRNPPRVPEFHPGMTIKVPCIELNIRRKYDELTGQVSNATLSIPIQVVVQDTRFQLNENGALLESEASMLMDGDTYPTKKFIFDRPFLLLLQQRDANLPYFALWIANAELLEPLVPTKK